MRRRGLEVLRGLLVAGFRQPEGRESLEIFSEFGGKIGMQGNPFGGVGRLAPVDRRLKFENNDVDLLVALNVAG